MPVRFDCSRYDLLLNEVIYRFLRVAPQRFSVRKKRIVGVTFRNISLHVHRQRDGSPLVPSGTVMDW